MELREKNEQLEHLLSELKAAEAQLIQSEKMAALGGIVGGIVHELNTPLGVISSAAGMVSKCTTDIQTALEVGSSAEDIRSDTALKTALETLEENKRLTELATERIGQIVGTLKSFARLDRAVFEPVDLHDGIETPLALLENRLQRIDVVRDYGTLPLVRCYSSEMNQLFLNLTDKRSPSDSKGRNTNDPNKSRRGKSPSGFYRHRSGNTRRSDFTTVRTDIHEERSTREG